MFRFLLRRLLFIAGTVITIIFFVFFGLNLAEESGLSPAECALQAFHSSLGYLRGVLHGDLGMVTRFSPVGLPAVPTQSGMVTGASRPISELISEYYPRSIGLLIFALALAFSVGLPAGSLAALRRHSRLSFPLLTLTLLAISAPSFFAALVLQMVAVRLSQGFGLHWLAAGGFGWDRRIILPGLVLAARPLAHVARVSFMALSEVWERDYIRTAKSKGLFFRDIFTRHALRNAAITILTALGVSFRFALSSLPVVEVIFGWPGIGVAMLEAIKKMDGMVAVNLAVCLGLTFMVFNLLLEIIYRYIDPRLRSETIG